MSTVASHEQDLQGAGYPKAQPKRDWQRFQYCGGSGGGDCAALQPAMQVRFPLHVNPYISRNRTLVLRNPENRTVRFYTDAGPFMACAHSAGVEQTWYLGLSEDGVMSGAEILAQNIPLSGAGPYDIEVPESKLPQPTLAAWDSIIYVHIYWGNATWVTAHGIEFVDDVQYLTVVRHEFDVRQ